MIKIEKLYDQYIFDDDTYFADYKYATNSTLKSSKGGSTHNMEHYINSDFPKSKALLLGSAFHCFFLEPEEFDKRFIWIPKVDRRTTEGKKVYQEYLDNSEGKEPISIEYKEAFECLEINLMKHPIVRKLIKGAKHETIHFWRDIETGVECKGKIDIEGKNFLADLKTTSERNGARVDKFKVFRDEYSIEQQAAFYLDGTEKKDFYFIMCELKAPYNVGVYKLRPESISRGREEYRSQLEEYALWLDGKEPTFYNNNKVISV